MTLYDRIEGHGMHMKDYTLTVRQVLESLATLADSYETVSRGGSPTGNYFFAVNVADMAASLKAAQVLISQLPCWIPVSERLPERNEIVLATDQDGVTVGSYSPMLDDWWTLHRDRMAPGAAVTHWMSLPEPPEVTK